MGMFRQVLDKFRCDSEAIDKNKDDAGNKERYSEEGYNDLKDEGQMDVEDQGDIQENRGDAKPEGESSIHAVGKARIEVIQLAKNNPVKDKFNKDINRIFDISEKDGELLEELERETIDRADILRKR